jgi:ribosomal protein S27E
MAELLFNRISTEGNWERQESAFMTTIINCPSCDRGLQLPESLAGQPVQCPTCGHTFTASADGHGASAPVYRPDDVELPPSSRPAAPPSHEEDLDEPPSRARRREKPAKVQAISIMMMIGGIYALVHALGATIGSGFVCCVWPGVYYAIVMGIMAIVAASPLLGENAHLQAAPRGIAIMQIINIINLDVVNCAMGIISLVFLNEPEVRRYFRG